jgi:diguanylate cyclase (GGDEF)-like protein/PAS domain S-box-containing protein
MDDARKLLERNLQLEQENRELRRREAMLRKLALAVEHSPVSVLITDRAGVIEYVNPKFCEVSGYCEEEAIGNTPRILKSGIHPAEFYRDLWEVILSGLEWRGEFLNRNKDGTMVWELASISPVFDEFKSITHFVGVKEDINELKRLQKELGEMAHSDDLTGLPNRALFMDRLGQVMTQAHRNLSRFALLFIDLDGFKEVNDSYGHLAGDQVLQEAAHRLLGCVRRTDTVARVGGDEFIIILSDLKHWEEPAVVAKKLLEAFAPPFRSGEAACRVGVSIGVSIYPDDAGEADNLISFADSAMYAAKQAGKNCFRYWSQLSGKSGAFRE